MSLETELKLSLSAASATALGRHPLLAGQTPQRRRLVNIYYDTPELDLWHARLAVRHRRAGERWLLTVKGGNAASAGLAQRAEWEHESLPGVFDFSQVDDAAVRRRLERLAPTLQPLFVTDFRRTCWLLSPAPGVRIEVALDRGRVSAGGRAETICELELELIEGPTSALFDLALSLGERVPLLPSSESKAETGFRLHHGEARRPQHAGLSPVAAEQGPRDAFRRVALECIDQLQRNLIGLRDAGDPEFVHQARVAIRRLRAALSVWAPALPGDFVATYREQWRNAARALGELRNLDVVGDEVLPQMFAALPRLRGRARIEAAIAGQRERARSSARRRLSSRRFLTLILRFVADLHALEEERAAGRALQSGDLERLARRRLRRLVRKAAARAALLASEQHPTVESAADDTQGCHALRIACKQLRYAGEFLSPLAAARPFRKSLAGMARLQTALGQYNDLRMAHALLARLAPERAALAWLEGAAAQRRAALAISLEALAATASDVPGAAR